MDTVTLKLYPLPPSSNALYRNTSAKERAVFHTKKMRRKTEEYTEYEKRVQIWSYRNGVDLSLARELTTRLGPGVYLRVDRLYKFHLNRILTKDLMPKRQDTTNRIKALDDTLALLLGLGDEWFWCGSEDKIWTETPKHEEGVDITLSLYGLDI